MARITQKEIHGVMTDVIEMDAPADELEDALRAQIAAEQAIESAETAQDAAERAEEAALRAEGNITGVSSFNGRRGAVKPQTGDYTAEQVGALPLTGGTLIGDIVINRSLPSVWFQRTSTNEDGAIQTTNGGMTIYSRPVKGDSTNWRSIVIRNSNRSTNLIDAAKVSEKGSNGEKFYNIFGEHNKPSGSYTGNGSTERRTIDVASIGKAILITSSHGFVILTSAGAVGKEGDNARAIMASEATFVDGVISFASVNNLLNRSGVTYKYQVL